MAELWDAYDAQRQQLVGRVLDRASFKPGQAYHLIVEVLVVHTDGQVLLMRRSADKASFATYYEATAGGSVLKGETSLEAARREVLEEMGLALGKLDLLYQRSLHEHGCHLDRYLARVDGDKTAIRHQAGETDHHVWISPVDLPDFLDKHPIIPSHIQDLRDYMLQIDEK